jgi:hypothetical protein
MRAQRVAAGAISSMLLGCLGVAGRERRRTTPAARSHSLAGRRTSHRSAFASALAWPSSRRTRLVALGRWLRHRCEWCRSGGSICAGAQFGIDLRTALRWISSQLSRVTTPIENAFAAAFRLGFRFWAPFVLTLVLQIGMLPLMAGDFHRINLTAHSSMSSPCRQSA